MSSCRFRSISNASVIATAFWLLPSSIYALASVEASSTAFYPLVNISNSIHVDSFEDGSTGLYPIGNNSNSISDYNGCSSVLCDITNHHEWWQNENITMKGLWNIWGCDGVFQNERPIHNDKTWWTLRGAYTATVGIELSYIDIKTIQHHSSGFEDGSVIIKQSPVGKGRAVYAARRFQEGEVVWRSYFTACFEEGDYYRHFLSSIPKHLACDVFIWAYVGTYGICVDLDEGSFVNHATGNINNKLDFENTREKPNVFISDEVGGMVALRNIEVGEEILIDYSSFEDEGAWEYYDLGRWSRY